MIKNLHFKCFTLFCILGLFAFSTQSYAQCDAGDLQTTGMVSVPDGSTFNAITINEMIPAGGAMGWVFNNSATNGTGGTGGTIILTGTTASETYDKDLNGVLSSNNLPPFAGTWQVYAGVYSNPNDPFNSICSDNSMTSYLVTFEASMEPCSAGVLQTTGSISVAEGDFFGAMAINDTIPSTGGYGWYFENANTGGTGGLGQGFVVQNLTTTETFNNDLNGVLSLNGFQPLFGQWEVYGVAYSDANFPAQTICSTTAQDSLIVTFEGMPDTSCFAGDMQTIGTDVVCFEESFTVETVNDTIAPGGAFGWVFFNDVTGGTGALDGNFILTGSSNLETFDADLNGILSGNNFPEFAGTWVVKAATYTDPTDSFNSICDFSDDSLIVVFNPELTASLDNVDNLSVSTSVSGGTAPFTYLWSNGETTESAMDLMDGTMTVTITDANGCTTEGSIDLMNTSVDDIKGLLDFSVSPNPTNSIARLTMNFEDAQSIKINMVSLQGKMIETIANERSNGGNYTLDLNSYNTGLYLIQVTTETGQFAERIFVR